MPDNTTMNPDRETSFLSCPHRLRGPFTPPAKSPLPLAAAVQPAGSYSQLHCPICNDEIFHRDRADCISNTACLHRGPCVKTACIKAYYGSRDQWATPYRGKEPLFCQAPGCGQQIEEWCYMRAVVSASGSCIMPVAWGDPAVEKAKGKAKEKEEKRRRKAERDREKQERKERKKREGGRNRIELGSVSGSRVLDGCLLVAMCWCCVVVLCVNTFVFCFNMFC